MDRRRFRVLQSGAAASFSRALAVLTPAETTLLPNYPDPFNNETWIPYHLAQSSDVEITIYDTEGRSVRRLAIGRQATGYYVDREKAAYWDGRGERGEAGWERWVYLSVAGGGCNDDPADGGREVEKQWPGEFYRVRYSLTCWISIALTIRSLDGQWLVTSKSGGDRGRIEGWEMENVKDGRREDWEGG